MTIREYADSIGFKIIGKLTRMVEERKEYNWRTGQYDIVKTVNWRDEAGNIYIKNRNGVCIIDTNGDAY